MLLLKTWDINRKRRKNGFQQGMRLTALTEQKKQKYRK
jgi:hypothetical protein